MKNVGWGKDGAAVSGINRKMRKHGVGKIRVTGMNQEKCGKKLDDAVEFGYNKKVWIMDP